MDSCYNLYNNIYMQHFLDNGEERNVSELEDDSEVSKLNSGRNPIQMMNHIIGIQQLAHPAQSMQSPHHLLVQALEA